VASLAGLAVAGFAMGAVVVVEQCRHVAVDDEYDVTAATTVSAIRATERLELLSVN
jgi:hypothetical protein